MKLNTFHGRDYLLKSDNIIRLIPIIDLLPLLYLFLIKIMIMLTYL